MKILTEKKQDEIIFLLCKNAKIFYGEDFDKFSKLHNNIVEICKHIGGVKCQLKYLYYMKMIFEEECEDNA